MRLLCAIEGPYGGLSCPPSPIVSRTDGSEAGRCFEFCLRTSEALDPLDIVIAEPSPAPVLPNYSLIGLATGSMTRICSRQKGAK